MKAFLMGFMEATNSERDIHPMSYLEAEDEWAWYSRQLSDGEIRRIERGGRASGLREGRRFLADFGDTPRCGGDNENEF